MPNVSSLVKTDYNAKIGKIKKKLAHHSHEKFITTPEFNKFTADIFEAKLVRTNLVTKTNFDTKLIKKSTQIKGNIYSLKIQFKRLQTFYSISFSDKSHFE